MTVNGSWDEALLTSEEIEMLLTHLCMSCVCERKRAYYSTRGNMAFSSLNSKGVERVYCIWVLGLPLGIENDSDTARAGEWGRQQGVEGAENGYVFMYLVQIIFTIQRT
jgi:hypothetical protein